jgi:predicted O-methyltransferase YrrM
MSETPVAKPSPTARARGKLGELGLRVAERFHGKRYIPLEYPPTAHLVPRYGFDRPPHARLAALLADHHQAFADALDRLGAYADDLARIPTEDPGDGSLFWKNRFCSGLDGAAIYGFVRTFQPKRYVEVGSGFSTMFAARAKQEGSPHTSITSIDPHPRAIVDALCDKVIRQPLESVDLGVFDGLSAGDIVFMDGSHRTFMNSDAVAFFLDVLPELPDGVVVGVDDVLLPDDYFPNWATRYYSEQYLLAAYLLAPAQWIDPLLPSNYVTDQNHLRAHLDGLWQRPNMRGVDPRGTSWWFTIRR